MSMHSSKVKCACGHVGAIEKFENDQAFAPGREEYTLDALDGSPTEISGGQLSIIEVFERMKPTCPKCKASLTPANRI